MVDKHEEVKVLMNSDLDWTIFRLPLVMDGNSSKSAQFSYSRMGGLRVFSRQVAAAVVEELSNGQHIRRQIDTVHSAHSGGCANHSWGIWAAQGSGLSLLPEVGTEPDTAFANSVTGYRSRVPDEYVVPCLILQQLLPQPAC